MNNPFNFEAEPFELGLTHESNTGLMPEAETWEIGSPWGYEGESGPAAVTPAPGVSGVALARAVAANRIFARRLGWGCVVGGHVRAIPQVLTVLGLAAGATEEDIVRALAQWQQRQLHQPGSGQLDESTWNEMRRRGVLPATRFTPGLWRVFARGAQIGIIEKTRAYSTHQDTTHAGVTIEFAFRATDMNAIRRAGFVDSAGQPWFRWIQVIELRTIFGDSTPVRETAVQRLRRAARGWIIDPTSALEPTLDADPYYWDEVALPGVDPGLRNTAFVNRPAANGLCYDLIFFDRPNMPLVAARPGRRAYFNFETALVAITRARRNVILNSLRWGFDIMLVNGVPRLGVNVLHAGPTGGSTAMRHVLGQEIAAGHFPGHCFVGGGFSRAATCT
jgi:hypothetical protein